MIRGYVAQMPNAERSQPQSASMPTSASQRCVSRNAVSTALACLRRVGSWARPRRQSLAIGSFLFVAAAFAFRLARLRAGYWTIDDAGITYAASYELADHGSLAAYIEGTPVESYSNPLLFFVVALLRLCGLFDPVRTHLHLEMLVFATMCILVWSMLRAWTRDVAAVVATLIFIAIELLTPATWAWYGSGLENVWVSAGLVTLLWICARTVRGKALSPVGGGSRSWSRSRDRRHQHTLRPSTPRS